MSVTRNLSVPFSTLPPTLVHSYTLLLSSSLSPLLPCFFCPPLPYTPCTESLLPPLIMLPLPLSFPSATTPHSVSFFTFLSYQIPQPAAFCSPHIISQLLLLSPLILPPPDCYLAINPSSPGSTSSCSTPLPSPYTGSFLAIFSALTKGPNQKCHPPITLHG